MGRASRGAPRVRRPRPPRPVRGGRGAPDVRCVDCRGWFPRARAVKYRAPGAPAIHRCTRCAAIIDAKLADLFDRPLRDVLRDYAPDCLAELDAEEGMGGAHVS